MNCEAELCVYNRNFLCILKTNEINSLGICENYAPISLDKTFLEAKKEMELSEIKKKLIGT